jgi:hypothetical protein
MRLAWAVLLALLLPAAAWGAIAKADPHHRAVCARRIG